MSVNQLTNTIAMVKPNHFGFNPQTAESNVFQHQVKESEKEVQEKALKEFNDADTESARCMLAEVFRPVSSCRKGPAK